MRKLLVPIIFICAIVGAFLGLNYSNLRSNKTLRIDPPKIVEQNPVGIPRRIKIPKINVDTGVESVAKDDKGNMDVPKNVFETAWYNLGPKPGEKGSAVLDGHLDTQTGAPAVFWNLGKLSTGDTIEITDSQNKVYIFKVTKVMNYNLNNIPLEQIFSIATEPMLNLITCGGHYDHVQHQYLERTVVYSKLDD